MLTGKVPTLPYPTISIVTNGWKVVNSEALSVEYEQRWSLELPNVAEIENGLFYEFDYNLYLSSFAGG